MESVIFVVGCRLLLPYLLPLLLLSLGATLLLLLFVKLLQIAGLLNNLLWFEKLFRLELSLLFLLLLVDCPLLLTAIAPNLPHRFMKIWSRGH
jgi:hypothetical protein